MYDPSAQYTEGNMPWTVFAYPISAADTNLMPLNANAVFLFRELQQQELPIGLWKSPFNNSVYFACPYEARDAVGKAIAEIENQKFGTGYFSSLCEELFAASVGDA